MDVAESYWCMECECAMAKTTALKFHPFELINQWGVTALHNVQLFVQFRYTGFADGVSLDVEDDEQGNFVGLGIYSPHSNTCHYWSDLECIPKNDLPKFVAHNGISDIRKLQAWGFKIDESWLLWDTSLMQHVIDSTQKSYGLKDICKREGLGEWPSYEDICGKKDKPGHKTLKEFPVDDVAQYNACDTYYTYKLYEKQRKQATAGDQLYFQGVEKPVAPVFHGMESIGIKLDVPYIKTDLKVKLEKQFKPIDAEIKNQLGVSNVNSDPQVIKALSLKGIHPIHKGKPSRSKPALERFRGNQLVELLLKHSELGTLLDNFVYTFEERNVEVVHPFFNQCGTRTGRPSCSNPNLLQIPRKTENGKLVRRMFIPRSGCMFGELDYGQIEPRILAHFSKDAGMLQMFNSGTDFHSYTAERIGIDRDRAKVLNLSVGYRATFKSVAQQLKCSDQEAQQQIDAWWSMFPGLKAWQTRFIWQVKKDGFFTTLLGRRIKVDNLNEYNKWKREAAERQLINNIAQASATEVMKMAMVQVHKAGVSILVQVYDSLLVEDKAEEIEDTVQHVASLMRNAVKLDVPLTVDTGIGNNWAACGDKK